MQRHGFREETDEDLDGELEAALQADKGTLTDELLEKFADEDDDEDIAVSLMEEVEAASHLDVKEDIDL